MLLPPPSPQKEGPSIESSSSSSSSTTRRSADTLNHEFIETGIDALRRTKMGRLVLDTKRGCTGVDSATEQGSAAANPVAVQAKRVDSAKRRGGEVGGADAVDRGDVSGGDV